MERTMKRPFAVLLATIACVAAICTVYSADADPDDDGTPQYDVGDYLKYIPGLKQGDSVGASAELDSDNAYDMLKIYADSFKIPINWTSPYNQMILKSFKGSSDINEFSSALCKRIIENDGMTAEPTITPRFDAGIAFAMTVSGTEKTPTLEIRIDGKVSANVIVCNYGKELINASLNIPVALYAAIHLSEENIPLGIDCRVTISYSLDAKDNTGDEEIITKEKIDPLDLRFYARMDGLTKAELNSIVNGDPSASVIKKIRAGMLLEATENDEKRGIASVMETSTDLTRIGIDDMISRLADKLRPVMDDVKPSDVKDDVKSLMNGIIPKYDDIEWILNITGADISRADYVKGSIIALPYLGQATWILKGIKDYVSENDLTSYYMKWGGNTIHADDMETISKKISVETYSPVIESINIDGCYQLDTRGEQASIYRFEYLDRFSKSLDITIPSKIMGKDVTQMQWECFKGPNTTALTLNIPDSVTYISKNAVEGYDYSGLGGTIKYYPDNESGYGFALNSWMSYGKAYASVSEWLNGNVTGEQAVEIPSEVTIGEKTITINEIEQDAFLGCTELSEVIIPDSVTEIGSYAFSNCSKLKTATVGIGVNELYRVFKNCNELESVIIRSPEISFHGTFQNCTALNMIEMASKAPLRISSYAFSGTKIDPTSIQYGGATISWIDETPDIGEFCFSTFTGPGGSSYYDGDSLYSCWKVDGEYLYRVSYKNVDNTNLTIPQTADIDGKYHGTIVDSSIENAQNMTDLTIEAPLKYLDLTGLPKLMNIQITNEECDIECQKQDGYIFFIKSGDLIFCNGSGETINLPESVYWINDKIPSGPDTLVINGDVRILSIPDSITTLTIGRDVDAVQMKNIAVKTIYVEPGNRSYKSIDGALFTIDGELIKYPLSRDQDVYTVPEGTKSIGYGAFYGSSLKTINLNSDLEHIDKYAFVQCDELISITAPDGNDSVYIDKGILYSDDVAIRYLGDADIVILQSGRWSNNMFDAKQPQIVVIQNWSGDIEMNNLWMVDTVVVPKTASCDNGSHIVSYPSNWMYTVDFMTDGKSLDLTVTTSAMLESTELRLDDIVISDNTRAVLSPSDLLDKGELIIAVQPAKYKVVFDTSGGPSVSSQDVYYHYCANIPGDPYRSGFTFTGWYADKRCTVEFDFESPILCDTTIYAGWRVIQTIPSEPITPPQPEKPESTEKVTVSTDEEGNTVTKVEKNTELDDGSKISSETTTVVKDNGNTKETVTESKETVTDPTGNVTGSTSTSKTERESDSGKSSVTSIVSKDGEGNETQTVTKVEMESKNSDITTSGELVRKSSGDTSMTIGTTIKVDSGAENMNVSHEQMSEAIEQAKEAFESMGLTDDEKKGANVTVEIRSEKFNDEVASIEMSSKSFLAASESNADLKLTSEVGSMTIGKDVSKNLSEKGESISVSMAVADKNELSSDVRNRVGDCPVYSLRAMAAGESIHQLGGDVVVSLKYTLKPGDDPKAITVYYVNDLGKLSKQTTSYDPVTHTLTFKTDHFSYFMISNSADLIVDEEPKDDSFPMIAFAAIAIVAIAIIAGVMIRGRH